MDEKPDSQLLRDYAEHRSEAAFRELVQRYTDLVYSAALRQVVSADAARDVAQEVFTDLAAKAKVVVGKSAGEASLAGWLYRSTRFAALNHLRDERRRVERERQVMEQTDFTPAVEPEWERIRPVLDEAMSDLNETDRDALLLRFFKNRDFRAIGQSLGLSDDAAQKRVSRALEKLRAEFARRGVTTSAVALSTALSANAVTVAPSGFSITVSASALAGISALPASVSAKVPTVTVLQKSLFGIGIGAICVITPWMISIRQRDKRLESENISLLQQVSQIENRNEQLSARLAELEGKQFVSSDQFSELLRLRNEVGQLRSFSNEVKQVNERALALVQMPRLKKQQPAPSDIPAGNIVFRNLPVRDVLKIYAEIAKVQVDIPERVQRVIDLVQISYTNDQPITVAEALDALESRMFEAGIKVQRVETNRAVVTFRQE